MSAASLQMRVVALRWVGTGSGFLRLETAEGTAAPTAAMFLLSVYFSCSVLTDALEDF